MEEDEDDEDGNDDNDIEEEAEEKVKKTNSPFSQTQRSDFCSFVIGSTFLPSEMSMIKCYGYIIPVSDFCVVNYCLSFSWVFIPFNLLSKKV